MVDKYIDIHKFTLTTVSIRDVNKYMFTGLETIASAAYQGDGLTPESPISNLSVRLILTLD